MKNFILITALVCSTFFVNAQEPKNISVTIKNIKNNKGTVLLALHTKDTFMKGKGIMSEAALIENNTVTITFKNVTPGEYGIIALHDENDNKRMDFNENGMPAEDYGTSNNTISFGPPQFNEAKFILADKDLDLNIRF